MSVLQRGVPAHVVHCCRAHVRVHVLVCIVHSAKALSKDVQRRECARVLQKWSTRSTTLQMAWYKLLLLLKVHSYDRWLSCCTVCSKAQWPKGPLLLCLLKWPKFCQWLQPGKEKAYCVVYAMCCIQTHVFTTKLTDKLLADVHTKG